jgi:hypothetical protein
MCTFKGAGSSVQCWLKVVWLERAKEEREKNAYTVFFKFSFCVFKFYQVIKLRPLYETGAQHLASVLVFYWLAPFYADFHLHAATAGDVGKNAEQVLTFI